MFRVWGGGGQDVPDKYHTISTGINGTTYSTWHAEDCFTIIKDEIASEIPALK